MKQRQLLTVEDAVETKCQHKTPCSDCPWARKAVRGWLGEASKEDWIQSAHGEARIECHTMIPHQCAGAAIYRANVIKSCRDQSILKLPANKSLVFSTPFEFLAHHTT